MKRRRKRGRLKKGVRLRLKRLRPGKRVFSAVAATSLALGRTSGEESLANEPQVVPVIVNLVSQVSVSDLSKGFSCPTGEVSVAVIVIPGGTGTYREILGLPADSENDLPCVLSESQVVELLVKHGHRLGHDVDGIFFILQSASGPLIAELQPRNGAESLPCLILEELSEAVDDSLTWTRPILVVKLSAP